MIGVTLWEYAFTFLIAGAAGAFAGVVYTSVRRADLHRLSAKKA